MFLFFTDYVALTTTPKEELKSLAEDLKEEVPAPLHTMLVEKESKEEAITKHKQRKEKETVICPPTCMSFYLFCSLFYISFFMVELGLPSYQIIL